MVASDMLELADICGWDKKAFARASHFIVNRILLKDLGQGMQKLRSPEELNPYIFQLMEAGEKLQPLTREEAYQAYLPQSNDPFLIDALLGRDGKRFKQTPIQENNKTTLKFKKSSKNFMLKEAKHDQSRHQ